MYVLVCRHLRAALRSLFSTCSLLFACVSPLCVLARLFILPLIITLVVLTHPTRGFQSMPFESFHLTTLTYLHDGGNCLTKITIWCCYVCMSSSSSGKIKKLGNMFTRRTLICPVPSDFVSDGIYRCSSERRDCIFFRWDHGDHSTTKKEGMGSRSHWIKKRGLSIAIGCYCVGYCWNPQHPPSVGPILISTMSSRYRVDDFDHPVVPRQHHLAAPAPAKGMPSIRIPLPC